MRCSRLVITAVTACLAAACGTTVPMARHESLQGGEPPTQSRPGDGGLGGAVAPVPSTATTPDLGGAPTPTTAMAPPGLPVVTGSTPAPGGAVTSPLEIGVLLGKPGGAAALGASDGNSADPNAMVKAVIADMNAHGGIGGRRIVPVYATFDSQASDYNTALQAACVTFTQDNHAALVLTSQSFYSEQFEACLAKHHAAHVDGFHAAGSDQSYRTYPGLITPATLSVERRVAGTIDAGTADGWLTSTNKLGVLLDDCPQNHNAFTHTLPAAATRNHLTIATTVTLSCTTGFASAGSAAAAMQNAVLSFRQAGVDRVMVISDFEATALFLFAATAESQLYRPGYVLSSLADPTVLAQNVTAAQAQNMRGLGWSPALDTAQPVFNAATRRCFALMAAKGVALNNGSDKAIAASVCEPFFFADAVLRLTRGNTSQPALLAALSGGAGAYGFPAGLAAPFLDVSRHDGVHEGRMFGWSTGCACFLYHGPQLALS